MTADDTDAFLRERRRLLGLAYRMLGSVVDAEDVVQEAWLRWQRVDRQAVDNPAAWLTTATTRLALDRLRAARREREHYVGPWLPEPVATGDEPAEAAELAESLTLGFLTLLETLSPTERAVLLLADVFGEPYTTVAGAVGKSESACRQIAHRARLRVRARPHVRTPNDDEVFLRFAAAMAKGDREGVLALLAADAVLVSDGGAAYHAARRPVVGADRVARFCVNIGKRYQPPVTVSAAHLNGERALVVWFRQSPMVATVVEISDGLIVGLKNVVNRDKLAALTRPVSLV